MYIASCVRTSGTCCLPVLKPVCCFLCFAIACAVWEQGLETERRNATALEDEVMTLKAALQVDCLRRACRYTSLYSSNTGEVGTGGTGECAF